MEEEANAFALELLMPSALLRADIAKMGGVDLTDDNAVERLAKRYRVPVAAMVMQLATVLALEK